MLKDDYKACFKYLSERKEIINVVDVGAARASFLTELSKYYKLDKVFSIGIDPLDHGVKSFYNKFYSVCVDNIPENTKQIKKFYINGIDQASSLSKINTENFTSNVNDKSKFFYSQDVLNNLSKIVKVVDVEVYNLNDILNYHFSEEQVIDVIKIDAEGKDLDIVKSLKTNFGKIKFISIECSSHSDYNLTRYENESTKEECLQYFEDNGFIPYSCIDYEYEPDNGTQMCDITFINKNL